MLRLNNSLRRLSDTFDHLLDAKVGLIKHVGEKAKMAGAPDFFSYVATACDTRAFCAEKNFAAGGGVAVDRRRAIAKAVGEAIERYCSAIYQLPDNLLFSYQAAPFDCVHPREFALYSEAQYQQEGFWFVPFGEQTPVFWTAMHELATGNTVYAPAAMVFIPYKFYVGKGENPITQPISTGLACHCSPTEAAISAICEVIERDAFTISWQRRLRLPHIRLESLSAKNRDILARFTKAGYRVSLLNMTMDTGVPAIMSVCRHDLADVPPLVVSAAAHMDAEMAICKSLEELEHTRAYCHKIKLYEPRLPLDSNYENMVVAQKDHLNFWCDETHLPLADFLFSPVEEINFSEIASLTSGDAAQDLQLLVDKITYTGHRVLIADLTTPDVAELGLSVVRALIPGFHPLFMGHRYRALGGKRLWQMPAQMGYNSINGDNPVPHPFP